MDAIGIFALVVAVVALVKILTIIIKPRAWFNLAERIWRAPTLAMVICIILAAVVFYNLIQELTIVQIFAVILFVALLSGVSVASYHNEMISMASKILKDRNFVKRSWISLVIWLVLILWALKELLI
ncbi:MAG: hypothetical protein KKB21_00815 [Nanoarchaeota archaeon]|nr:hypothetical protein [Nanoarchaeota archaeon]MBU4086097.1 hypothetical protein [Nanoarchaeota archaeon]